MTTTETGPDPFWNTELGKRTALHEEIADIIAGLAPKPKVTEKPDGYFARPDVPDHEVAEYLHATGNYSTRYRTEH